MANHDPNHSSKERTALWVILPATILTSLFFTRLNHKMAPNHEVLSSDFSQSKKAALHAPAPAHEEHAMPADTMHKDTVYLEATSAPAVEHHSTEAPKH